ncbi:hypothetical protein J2Z26_002857 [Bacillus luteolus]|nr:hypothetical protein [Cytobacillus luteolus]
MSQFQQELDKWLYHNIENEKNHRRREILENGL